MKKTVSFLLSIILFSSCFNNDDLPNFTYRELPIDSYIVPDSFTFGEKDTITVTYTLPNGCYSFDKLLYNVQDTTRFVAITAFVDLDLGVQCTTAIITEEYKFPVLASQKEDYLFKFFKGVDDDGEYIFEEVIVPVN